MARKSRKDIKPETVDVMVPLDITKLGSDEDPCFGKLYDLSTDECQRCGDSEFCSIKMSQTMNIKRKSIEGTQEFKDISGVKPQVDNNEVYEYMVSLKRKGLSALKIKMKARKKFNIDKEKSIQIYLTL